MPLTQRLNYYNGLFLQDVDFTIEQDYHRERLEHHHKLMHTSGICDGLDVTADVNATQVEVTAGTALNRQGQFIILAINRTLTPADIAGSQGKKVLLTIRYGEQGVKKSSDETTPSRTVDNPRLQFVEPANLTPDDIQLAEIEFNSDGSVKSANNGVRRSAGVNIGTEVFINRLTLRVNGADESLWPSINASPSGRELNVNGALSVSGNMTTTGNLNFSIQMRQMINLWGSDYGIGIQGGTQYFRTGQNFAWFLNGVHDDATLVPGAGGIALMVLNDLGPLVPPTDRAKLQVNGTIQWGNNGASLIPDQGGSIELGGNPHTVGGGLPYIDFHFNGKQEDFNVRLMNDADGQLSVYAPEFHVNVPASTAPIGAMTVDVATFANPSASYFLQMRDLGANNGQGETHFYVRGDGNVGIGTSIPDAKLQVVGGAIMPHIGNDAQSGIYFPPNPGGGAGDEAWIRYYSRFPARTELEFREQTTLEIGIGNDANDILSFHQAGDERLRITRGHLMMIRQASNDEADAILNDPDTPNFSILMATWDKALYFYWKDQDGVICSLKMVAPVTLEQPEILAQQGSTHI